MRKALMLVVVVCSTVVGSQPSGAQQLLESYVAQLSERDHFNSSGQRLTTAAAVIRQDRANFHRFGLRDPADQDDKFFADVGNRAALERLLEHGHADAGAISAIVNGTPFIRVEVWQGNAGPYVVVTLIDSPTNGSGRAQEANGSPPSSPEQTPGSNEPRTGTAFYVSGDGYLITNEHVVNSCNALKVIDATGESVSVRIVRTSKSDDLALLKANAEPRFIAAFRESGGIGQGGTVVTYGYPLTGLLASTGNVATGLVTALSGLDDNPRQMQISTPVQPGNSGSPLVDMKGAVVGVVVSKLNAIAVARVTSDIPQNINFAIKASAVMDLLEANSVKYRSESFLRELSVEQLTQQMKQYTVEVVCN